LQIVPSINLTEKDFLARVVLQYLGFLTSRLESNLTKLELTLLKVESNLKFESILLTREIQTFGSLTL
jgi:hypothetical protein